MGHKLENAGREDARHNGATIDVLCKENLETSTTRDQGTQRTFSEPHVGLICTEISEPHVGLIFTGGQQLRQQTQQFPGPHSQIAATKSSKQKEHRTAVWNL